MGVGLDKLTYIGYGAMVVREELKGFDWEDPKWLPRINGDPGVNVAMLSGGASNGKMFVGIVLGRSNGYAEVSQIIAAPSAEVVGELERFLVDDLGFKIGRFDNMLNLWLFDIWS